jgi:hypothetical protein
MNIGILTLLGSILCFITFVYCFVILGNPILTVLALIVLIVFTEITP